MSEMSVRARDTYLRLYTPQANHKRLMEIYEEARAAIRSEARVL